MDHLIGDVLETLGAMSRIGVTWAAVLAVFSGIGLGLRRLWGLRGVTADVVLGGFWTGLVVVVLVLSLWHLAWPVHWPVQLVIAVLGGAGLVLAGRDTWAWARVAVPRHRGMGIAVVLVALLMANRALGPCTTSDSGLYHLNAVRWTTEFRIIPGLGNLHGPLAYNNAGLLIAALLDVGPWAGRSSHLANPLYLLVLVFHILLAAFRLVRAERESPLVQAFWLFLLTPAVLMLNRSWATSHNVEVLVAVVVMVASGRMLAFLMADPHPGVRQDFDVLAVVLLLALAVCVKLSSLPLAVTAGVVVIAVYVRRCRQAGRALGALRWILGLPIVLLTVWLWRGVILSGCLLYPFPLGTLPVDWRMPEEQVDRVRQAIVGEAFWRIRVEGVLDWVGHLGRQVMMPTVVTLAGLGVVARWRRRLGKDTRRAWWVVISVIPAIGVWAATAPQKRFAFFLFWTLAGVMGALALAAVGLLEARRRRAAVAVALLVVGSVSISPRKVFYGPGNDGGLHPASTAAMTTYVTAGNLMLYVPKEGDQCWDSPLPSTPHPRPDLRLRRPGDLASGFVIDPSLVPPSTQPSTHRVPPGDD